MGNCYSTCCGEEPLIVSEINTQIVFEEFSDISSESFLESDTNNHQTNNSKTGGSKGG